MKQIAAGKRINGFWHVWVEIDGQVYAAIGRSLQRAISLAVGTHPLGPPVSKVVN